MFQATQERFQATQEYSVVTVSRYLLSLDICCLSILYGLAVFVRRHISIFIFHLSSFIGRLPECLPRCFPFRVSVLPKVSRLCLLKSRDSCCLSILYGLAVFVRRHFSTFISRPPESLPRGFSLRFSILQKVSRLCLLKSRDFCCLAISQLPRCLRQAPFLHFHQSPARKFPERLFSPIQRPPESFPTTPPEISRFPFGTKVIKILDLSPYLPPTRPFAVSPTLSYSPKPVLHQPRHQTESAPLVHQSPCTFYPHLTLSYNNTHQSSSSLPTITKFAFPTVHYALFSFSLAI